MPISSLHPSYSKMLSTWVLLRDVVAGDTQVKSKGSLYVPRLTSQKTDSDTSYQNMLNRPVFENVTAKTESYATGQIFAKDPVIVIPDSMNDFLDNMDLKGSTFEDMAQNSCSEVGVVGRVGVLVDMAATDTDGMTAGDVEALNIRPYSSFYNTESIINWDETVINNRTVLSMVILKETRKEWVNEYEYEEIEVFRKLKLEEGIYKVSIIKEGKDGDEILEEFYPKMNGKNLTFIPFAIASSNRLEIEPQKSVLLDLAQTNLSYFKLDVDLHHGLHWTAIPTGYGSGMNLDEGEEITLGAETFMTFDLPDAKLSYLEFEGKGLDAITKKLESKKEDMVVQGSSMLQGDKNMAEAENTVAMRTAGERASTITISKSQSRMWTKVFEWMRDWSGASGEVSVELNTDFNLTEMPTKDMIDLSTAKTMGIMSSRGVYYNLKKGERINNETFEEYQTELEEETPVMTESPIKKENKTEDKSTLSNIKSMIGL